MTVNERRANTMDLCHFTLVAFVAFTITLAGKLQQQIYNVAMCLSRGNVAVLMRVWHNYCTS